MRIDEFFFFLIWAGWGGSFFLLLMSYFKYKVLTFFDVGVVLSWFFVFFRPLYVYACDINLDLYYWNESLYGLGAIISVAIILVFQVSGLLVKRSSLMFWSEFNSELFGRRLERASFVAFVFCCVAVLVMFLKFGMQVFPSNRGAGALSVSMPGLEIYYHIIRALTLVLIVFSVVSFLIFRSLTGLLYAFFSITVLLIFAKRNAIIYPFVYSVFLYSIYYVYFVGGSLFKVFIKIFPLLVFLVFIAFFGKSFKSERGFEFDVPIDGYSCQAVRLGMQEFDLFWPAVLETAADKVNVQDLPSAVFGALAYGHAARLQTSSLSITDRTMLEYNYDNYVYNKFGISPSFAQFYYYYFWWWSFIVVAGVAFFARKLDFILAGGFYNSRFGVFLCAVVLSKLIMSPFDFTIKYSVFESVVFFALYVAIRLYFSLLPFVPKK